MWERIRHIPPFIAAILGIAGSVMAVATVVVSYFVSYDHFQRVIDSLRLELAEAKCLSNTWYSLLDSQLQQKISSDEVNDLTEVILALQELKRDNVQVIIKSYGERVETLSHVLVNARSRAEELQTLLVKGTCTSPENST